MKDLNLTVTPDCTLPKFTAQQQALQALGLMDQQAANALGNLWTIENDKAKTIWQEWQQVIAIAEAKATN